MDSIDIFYDEKNVVKLLSSSIKQIINQNFVIICIGTDKFIFDSLGPLVGTLLTKSNLKSIHIYGTIEHPITAKNLEEELFNIKERHPNSKILAIDACLGSNKNIGKIYFSNRPIHPGLGVKIKLPKVGDYSIKVTTATTCSDIIRLNLIMNIAEVVAESIIKAIDI